MIIIQLVLVGILMTMITNMIIEIIHIKMFYGKKIESAKDIHFKQYVSMAFLILISFSILFYWVYVFGYSIYWVLT